MHISGFLYALDWIVCFIFPQLGLEFLFSEIETDSMTMTNMHSSRHSVDFRSQVEEWMHLLQELGKHITL